MRRPPKNPTDGLREIDREEPEIVELLSLWRTFDFFEAIYNKGFKVRDDRLARLAAKHSSGPLRGFSTRFRIEIDMSEPGLSSAKQRARKNRMEGKTPSDRESRAILAAMRAAVVAYELVMSGERERDEAAA